VLTRLAGLAADSAALREAIRSSLLQVAAQNGALGEAVRSSVMEVSSKLEGHTLLTGGLLTKVDETALRIEQVSGNVVQALKGHAEQVTSVNVRFEAVASASQDLNRQLEAVVASNAQLLDSSRKRLEGVERAAAHSESIVVGLAELNPLLKRQVEALQANAVLRATSAPAAVPVHGGAAPTNGVLILPADGWRTSTQVPQPQPQPGQVT
jgi:methyl-accepting chemotaxis protein